jgi:hypothetical protein
MGGSREQATTHNETLSEHVSKYKKMHIWDLHMYTLYDFHVLLRSECQYY